MAIFNSHVSLPKGTNSHDFVVRIQTMHSSPLCQSPKGLKLSRHRMISCADSVRSGSDLTALIVGSVVQKPGYPCSGSSSQYHHVCNQNGQFMGIPHSQTSKIVHVFHSCPIKIVWNPQWYPIQSRVPLQFSDTPRIILISSWLQLYHTILTIHVPSNIQLKPIKLMPKQSIFRAHPKKNHLAAVHIRDEYHHHSTYIYIYTHIYTHIYIYI